MKTELEILKLAEKAIPKSIYTTYETDAAVHHSRKKWADGYTQAMHDYASSSSMESQWISVEERLPDFIEGKDYSDNVFAICDHTDELMVMCYCFLPDDDGNWFYAWCNCYGKIDGEGEFDDNYTVIKWQPLPTK